MHVLQMKWEAKKSKVLKVVNAMWLIVCLGNGEDLWIMRLIGIEFWRNQTRNNCEVLLLLAKKKVFPFNGTILTNFSVKVEPPYLERLGENGNRSSMETFEIREFSLLFEIQLIGNSKFSIQSCFIGFLGVSESQERSILVVFQSISYLQLSF